MSSRVSRIEREQIVSVWRAGFTATIGAIKKTGKLPRPNADAEVSPYNKIAQHRQLLQGSNNGTLQQVQCTIVSKMNAVQTGPFETRAEKVRPRSSGIQY